MKSNKVFFFSFVLFFFKSVDLIAFSCPQLPPPHDSANFIIGSFGARNVKIQNGTSRSCRIESHQRHEPLHCCPSARMQPLLRSGVFILFSVYFKAVNLLYGLLFLRHRQLRKQQIGAWWKPKKLSGSRPGQALTLHKALCVRHSCRSH